MIIRAVFMFLGRPKAHGNSGRDDKGEGRYGTELRSRKGQTPAQRKRI
jgi:hypothetical protein